MNPQKAREAAQAVKSVIEDFKKRGATEEEFLRGREQAKSGSVFSQENTSSQMLLYGKQMLYKNEVYDFEKRMSEISALTLDDIGRAISENYDFTRAAVATVGNLDEGIEL